MSKPLQTTLFPQPPKDCQQPLHPQKNNACRVSPTPRNCSSRAWYSGRWLGFKRLRKPSGPDKALMGLIEALGALWSLMEPYGALWSLMEPYGA